MQITNNPSAHVSEANIAEQTHIKREEVILDAENSSKDTQKSTITKVEKNDKLDMETGGIGTVSQTSINPNAKTEEAKDKVESVNVDSSKLKGKEIYSKGKSSGGTLIEKRIAELKERLTKLNAKLLKADKNGQIALLSQIKAIQGELLGLLETQQNQKD